MTLLSKPADDLQPRSHLRIGTRRSALARWQADWVAARLQELGVEVELVLLTTSGDQQLLPIGQLGAQGVFTKEIQRAVLDGRIDLAVHSLKDLPTESCRGCCWRRCRRGRRRATFSSAGGTPRLRSCRGDREWGRGVSAAGRSCSMSGPIWR